MLLAGIVVGAVLVIVILYARIYAWPRVTGWWADHKPKYLRGEK